MRPCAAACLRGHTTWLGGVAAWFDGGFPWCRAGARSHTFRVAGGRFGDPAPSTVWLRKALRLARTHCAHPLARRPRVLVARQHAVSEPTSLTCGRWTGKRLPDHTLGPPHGARALVVHARARRVGRGGNERAHTARAMASRGRIGGGARCTPRGRGRRPRGRGRVTGARGSHNDAALATAPPPAMPSSRSLGGTKKKLRAFMHGARRRPRGPAFGFLIRSCPYELP